jgi:hypothetical protein
MVRKHHDADLDFTHIATGKLDLSLLTHHLSY